MIFQLEIILMCMSSYHKLFYLSNKPKIIRFLTCNVLFRAVIKKKISINVEVYCINLLIQMRLRYVFC